MLKSAEETIDGCVSNYMPLDGAIVPTPLPDATKKVTSDLVISRY